MDLPVLLPKELNVLEELNEEEAIIQFLLKFPDKIIIFMDHALRDISWSYEHLSFLQKLFLICTKKFREGSFAYFHAMALKDKLYSNQEILEKIINNDIVIWIEKEFYPINSLLFATSSELFYEYFRFQCLENRKKTIHLEEKIFNFEIIQKFIQNGVILDLWKLEKEKLLELLLTASDLKIARFVTQIAEIYYRYLDEESSKKLLKLSLEEQIPQLSEICIKYINIFYTSFFLYLKSDYRLGFGFKEFIESSEENFQEFLKYITDLSFTKLKLEKESIFPYIQKIKNLRGLILSETSPQFNDFRDLPESILEIDLSMCYWLTPQIFEQIIESCPNIRDLFLKRNTHLNLAFWNVFLKFSHLDNLDLGRCYQITDDDLKLITKSINFILKISLEGCNKITDISIIDLVKKFHGIIDLNIAGTEITDSALVEIGYHCPNLEVIHLEKCKNVTDLGIQQLKKMCKKLKF